MQVVAEYIRILQFCGCGVTISGVSSFVRSVERSAEVPHGVAVFISACEGTEATSTRKRDSASHCKSANHACTNTPAIVAHPYTLHSSYCTLVTLPLLCCCFQTPSAMPLPHSDWQPGGGQHDVMAAPLTQMTDTASARRSCGKCGKPGHYRTRCTAPQVSFSVAVMHTCSDNRGAICRAVYSIRVRDEAVGFSREAAAGFR